MPNVFAVYCSEGDVWVGSWTPPPGGRRLMYKYLVSDGVDASDDNFEWLGQTTWGDPINRYVDIPGNQFYDIDILRRSGSQLPVKDLFAFCSAAKQFFV